MVIINNKQSNILIIGIPSSSRIIWYCKNEMIIEKQGNIKLFLHILTIALAKKSLRFKTIMTKCSRHIRKRRRRMEPTLMFTLKRDVLLIIIILLQNVSHNSAGTEQGFTATRSQSLPALLHCNSFLIRNELRDYYCCTSLPPSLMAIFLVIVNFLIFENDRSDGIFPDGKMPALETT